jgi:hypothetical protein
MWIISQEVKDETIAVLASISKDEAISPRDRIKATEVLGKLEAQNTPAALHQHVHMEKPPEQAMTFEERKQHLRQRIDRLKRLGIT